MCDINKLTGTSVGTCAILKAVAMVGHSMPIIDYEVSENTLLLYNCRTLDAIRRACSHIYETEI